MDKRLSRPGWLIHSGQFTYRVFGQRINSRQNGWMAELAWSADLQPFSSRLQTSNWWLLISVRLMDDRLSWLTGCLIYSLSGADRLIYSGQFTYRVIGQRIDSRQNGWKAELAGWLIYSFSVADSRRLIADYSFLYA